MKKNKSKIHHAKTIEEAIDDIERFFECDMWYAKGAEWKAEKDMRKYLRIHFNFLREEIKRVLKKNSPVIRAKKALNRLRVRS